MRPEFSRTVEKITYRKAVGLKHFHARIVLTIVDMPTHHQHLMAFFTDRSQGTGQGFTISLQTKK
jgi:hypothetical protein